MKYSLIIPTYNEAPVIIATLRAHIETFEQSFPGEWEIIVADNASTDDTAGVVSAMRDSRVHVLHLRFKGKGRALRAGFESAKGEVIGFTDADLSIPSGEIVSAMLHVEEHPYLVVIGSRSHPKTIMPGREWWRTGSSRIFNILARQIVGIHASDTQCPLKVMSQSNARAMRTTKEDTWFADLEFIALLEQLRTPIEEVPVTWDEHRYPDRESKLSTIKDGLQSITAMYRIRERLPSLVSEMHAVQS